MISFIYLFLFFDRLEVSFYDVGYCLFVLFVLIVHLISVISNNFVRVVIVGRVIIFCECCEDIVLFVDQLVY